MFDLVGMIAAASVYPFIFKSFSLHVLSPLFFWFKSRAARSGELHAWACLVLAGAGSGKTRVITHKIGRLIQSGVAGKNIAAITFTNKAAAEMRERARQLIGKAAKDVVICTFHALGVRMLRQDGAALGLKPQFSILDTDDITSILKDAGGTWMWRRRGRGNG